MAALTMAGWLLLACLISSLLQLTGGYAMRTASQLYRLPDRRTSCSPLSIPHPALHVLYHRQGPPSIARRSSVFHTSLSSSSNDNSSSVLAPPPFKCKIKVLGVGGGGCNAVNRLVTLASPSLECWAINTDAQSLKTSLCSNTLLLTSPTSRKTGQGAGGDPSVGLACASASASALSPLCSSASLVFVTGGLGGGTGSGALPFVASLARRSGALVVAVVTTPFLFEGRQREVRARKALENLRLAADAVVVVDNEKLRGITPVDATLTDAFKVADDVLRQAVMGISDLILKPGLVNVDFADLRSMLSNSGPAIIGLGSCLRPTKRSSSASSPSASSRSPPAYSPAVTAAHNALSSPLLSSPVGLCGGVLFNVVGGAGMSMTDVADVADVVRGRARDGANVIFGAAVDETLEEGEIQVTVLATGFEKATLAPEERGQKEKIGGTEEKREKGFIRRAFDMLKALY